jgi:hypothetical protein
MYNVDSNEVISIDELELVNKKDVYFWSITCHG